MGDEEIRRLSRQMVNSTYGYIGWSTDYGQWLNDVCREIIEETNPDVSLVKRYDKGSFKFV